MTDKEDIIEGNPFLNRGDEKSSNANKSDMWDSSLYPERNNGQWKRSWIKTLIGFEGRESLANLECERNVYKALKSPLVKLLIGALESSGCKFDFRRHVCCEMCDERLAGGYDPDLNQIIICQNVTRTEPRVESTMAHELIHMFDYCKQNFDFKNLDHVACSEVRAANLTGCSFFGSVSQGSSSFTNIKQTHKTCVHERAVLSVLAIKKVSRKEAEAAVDRVFSRCYQDMEPIGRRIKRNSNDLMRSYREGYYYGYL